MSPRVRAAPPRGTSGSRVPFWPPFPLGLPRRRRPLPFPLDQAGCRVYHRARQGLWHGVRALGLRPGDEVLVPAYHQGAEVEAFVRAGLSCRYYDTDDLLQPDAARLEALLGQRVRALHLIHYWGFPQDSARWRTWCDERGLLLVEDGAQAILARTSGAAVGSFGDLAVFCLYKSFGLPDGGAAVCRAPLPAPTSRAGMGARALAGRVGSAAAQRSRLLARAHRRVAASGKDEREFGTLLPGELELGDTLRPPFRLTSAALAWVVDAAAGERRRANYAYLLARLRELVPAPFATLSAGAVPFAFPVSTRDPAELGRRLERAGIDTGRLWPTWHPTLEPGEFPVARRFREGTLALPVHQALRGPELDRVAAAVLSAAEGRR